MKSFLLKLLLAIALFGGIFGYFFSREIYASASTDLRGLVTTEREQKGVGPGSDVKIVGYRLKDVTRDLADIEVRALSAVVTERSVAEVSFQLVNKGEARFPGLRLFLQGGDGALIRTVELAPADYGASGAFDVQQVTVKVQLRGAEMKVAVAPFFEGVAK